MYDDIPEAVRQSVKEPSRTKLPRLALLLGGGALGILAIAFLLMRISPPPAPQASTPASAPNPSAVQPTPAAAPVTAPVTASSPSPDALLGHLAYAEAPAEELVAITADGQIKLRSAAAAAYEKMKDAAAAEGINLLPISGFRSVSDQDDLFFRVKEQRNQDVSKRAEVSAPPGHSEHHTGYAVDIGDADQQETNLDQTFENTAAFRWLAANAAQYSFELSFPRDNPQGVSYEPWHWRFVGDRNSLETFYRAQNLKSNVP